jgi:hypothetical protein
VDIGILICYLKLNLGFAQIVELNIIETIMPRLTSKKEGMRMLLNPSN